MGIFNDWEGSEPLTLTSMSVLLEREISNSVDGSSSVVTSEPFWASETSTDESWGAVMIVEFFRAAASGLLFDTDGLARFPAICARANPGRSMERRTSPADAVDTGFVT